MQFKTKTKKPLWKIEKDFISYAIPVIQNGRLLEADDFLQHAATTRYAHCVAVAYYSLRLAEKLQIPCDKKSLVTGALLHDYFFYDWHESDITHMYHGFTHPKAALKNALCDFDLNSLEQNIILRHMFPVTPIPPKNVEGLIICFTDKFCGLAETLRINKTPLPDCPDIWKSVDNEQ